MQDAEAGPSWAMPRERAEQQQMTSVRQTELYKLLKPLMVYMEASLLLHVRECKEHEIHRFRSAGPTDGRWKKAILRCAHVARFLWDVCPFVVIVFCLIGLCLCVFEVQNRLHQLEFLTLSMELVAFVFVMQNCISLIVMYANCESGLMLHLFRAYEQLSKDDAEQKQRLDATVVRTSKIVLVVCMAANLFICITWQLFLHLSYTGQIDTGCIGATLVFFTKKTPFYYYSLFWGVIFVVPPFTQMAGLDFLLCFILRTSYEAVNYKIKMKVQLLDEDADLRSGMSAWFAEHRRITRMVGSVSQVFGLYCLTFLILNITLACFLTYIILFSCYLNALTTTIQFGWGLCAFLVGFFFLSQAILVNVRALKCWHHLSNIRMKHVTTRHGVHLAVFLERLSSKRAIGISACGFFTVTHQFFIWLLSSLVSYFMVLVKFSPPRPTCDYANITCSRPRDDY